MSLKVCDDLSKTRVRNRKRVVIWKKLAKSVDFSSLFAIYKIHMNFLYSASELGCFQQCFFTQCAAWTQLCCSTMASVLAAQISTCHSSFPTAGVAQQAHLAPFLLSTHNPHQPHWKLKILQKYELQS